MKISLKVAFIAIASLGMLVSSCSTSIEVAKRKHRKGYHVSINHNKTEKGQIKMKESIEFASVDSPIVDTVNIEPMILDQSTELAALDSPSVDTVKTDEVIPSIKSMLSSSEKQSKKQTVVQKIKTLNKVRKQMKQLRKSDGFQTASSDDDWEIDNDVIFIIMVVLAIVLPPIVVYLIKGKSNAFILNFLLWLIGFGLAYAILGPGIAYLGGLLAIIHALLVLFGHS